jgi:hypothetical protein
LLTAIFEPGFPPASPGPKPRGPDGKLHSLFWREDTPMGAKPFDSTILADAAGALDFITNVFEASTEYSTPVAGSRAYSRRLSR